MQQSEIIRHRGGGTSLVGPDAMKLFKAVQLRGFLGLYRKTGLIPTRGVGIKAMLGLAKEFTGKAYTTKQIPQAEEDLRVWIETMKAAIPTTVEGCKQ